MLLRDQEEEQTMFVPDAGRSKGDLVVFQLFGNFKKTIGKNTKCLENA